MILEWNLQIEPQIQSGKNILIAAHGNSLRSIIMYLDALTSQEVWMFSPSLWGFNFQPFICYLWLMSHLFQVISLELSTGIPLLYIFKEGKFLRRGSPVGPTEAGVYAYSRVCYDFPDFVHYAWHAIWLFESHTICAIALLVIFIPCISHSFKLWSEFERVCDRRPYSLQKRWETFDSCCVTNIRCYVAEIGGLQAEVGWHASIEGLGKSLNLIFLRRLGFHKCK